MAQGNEECLNQLRLVFGTTTKALLVKIHFLQCCSGWVDRKDSTQIDTKTLPALLKPIDVENAFAFLAGSETFV